MALGWCGLLAYLLTRAFLQYRAFASLDDRYAPEPDAERPPSVTFIVPARNEARNIGRCLDGLLAQGYPRSRYRIVVVDDGSVDETREIVKARMAAAPGLNLELQTAEGLPAGWAGKPHACWQGASSPAARDAEWLCFVDADTVAKPGFLRAAIGYAQLHRADMLSVCPRQELRTLWERTFFLVGLIMLAFVKDVRSSGDPRSSVVAANGQCLLVRRSAYADCGGHAAVASEICEDSALALQMKLRGYRVHILGGERFVRTRMYDGWSDLRDGLGKNIVEAVGGYGKTILAFLLAVVLTVGSLGLPVWTALTLHAGWASIAAFALSLFGSAALLTTYVRAARYFEIPVWYVSLFPLGYAVGTAIAVYGIRARFCGAVAWKGRLIGNQPPARACFSSIRRVASRIRLTGVRR
jgi:chlorobactene glucosyltransferase